MIMDPLGVYVCGGFLMIILFVVMGASVEKESRTAMAIMGVIGFGLMVLVAMGAANSSAGQPMQLKNIKTGDYQLSWTVGYQDGYILPARCHNFKVTIFVPKEVISVVSVTSGDRAMVYDKAGTRYCVIYTSRPIPNFSVPFREPLQQPQGSR